MRSNSRGFALGTALLLAASVAAQQNPNIQRGLVPGVMIPAGEVDTINSYTGAPALVIPIGQRFGVGGGGLGWQLVLSYSSNVWDLEYRVDGENQYIQAWPSTRHNFGMGWRLKPGELWEPQSAGNDSIYWLYIDPYGGEHLLYPTLHEGETQNSSYAYSRDGSYLRLRDWPATANKIVEYPDGTMHWFEADGTYGLGGWRHVGWSDWYQDQQGNFLNRTHISYTQSQWDIWDDNGRHVYVNTPSGGVASVVVPGVGPLTGTYSFGYTTTSIERSCLDNDDMTSDTFDIGLLTSVTLPDGSSYQFSYNTANAANCAPPNLPGTLSSYRLPTGGRVDYTWMQYDFPIGCSKMVEPWMNKSAGIATRKLYDGATTPALLGTWTYQRPPEDPLSTQVKTIVTSPQPLPAGECGTGSDCVGNDTVYYFRTMMCPSFSDWSGWDHGLPYTLGTQNSSGTFTAYLSSRTYQGSYTSGSLKRSTYLLYEHDKLPSGGWSEWLNCNRRRAGERTVYEDDGTPPKYADVRHLNYDGLGSYRVALTGGSFASGNERRTRTNLNASRGTYKINASNANDTTYSPLGYPSTYNPSGCNASTTCDSPPHSYTAFPVGVPWILDTYTFTEATENGVKAHQDHCFESSTGFLQRVRTYKTGTTPGQYDLVSVFGRDARGGTVSEEHYGGDGGGIGNTGNLCTLTFDSPETTTRVRVDYNHQNVTYGDRLRAWNVDPSGNALSFYLTDLDLDLDTGLPTASRDTAGVQTGYEYDSSNRLRWEKPQTSSPVGGAWVEHQYFNWSAGSDFARVESYHRPNGSTTGVLARDSLRYDEYGRPSIAKQLLANGSWNQKKTAYSVLGFPRWGSEWHPSGTSDTLMSKTSLSGFDPFGRASLVTRPDGSSVAVTYAGVRQVARTVNVGTSRDPATGNINQTPATTTEIYDRQGRLISVQEPSGDSGAQVTSSYTYDVGSRLYQASTTSNAVTQTRTWSYDNRGFLNSETLPEVGASGNGTITYSKYDPRGLYRRLQDGLHDVAFTYDAAGRLTQVAQGDGSGNPSTPVLRELTYATANGTNDWKKGKLTTAVMHNMVSTTDYPVSESYVYGGRQGAVSSRTTTVEGRSISQAFTWNDLGQVASLGYPDDSGIADPARTISYTYTNGFLTRVPSYTHASNNITYHVNGLVNAIPHVNNVTVTQAIATNNMQRPATISTSGASPNWSTGAYSFDGSNNIVKMGSDWFIYDPVSRIKTGRVYGASLQQDYTYDAFGFITSITTTPGGTQTFAPVSGTNHISGTNNYDAAGNMLFWGSYTYSWDRLNTLQKLTTPTEHWYFYSADGERIVEREGSVTSPTSTTLTIRGLDGKVLRIYTKPSGGSFSWTKDYVYRDGQLLATVDSGGTRHFHLDHLGTPRWITNSSAAKVAEHTYYPFGYEASGTTDWERMKFTGHERDLQGTAAQTDDLDYMHARHYNLNIGRFLTLDPVRGDPAAPQSFNLFAYVRNNPVNLIDPLGLDCVETSPGVFRCSSVEVEVIADFDTSGGKEGLGWPRPRVLDLWCFVTNCSLTVSPVDPGALRRSQHRRPPALVADPRYGGGGASGSWAEFGDPAPELALAPGESQDPMLQILGQVGSLYPFMEAGYSYMSMVTLPLAAGSPAATRPFGTSGWLLGKGGLLNSNRYLRLGWGKHDGRWILRSSGQVVQYFKRNGHWDIWAGNRY